MNKSLIACTLLACFFTHTVFAQVAKDFKQGEKIIGVVTVGNDGLFGTTSKRTFVLPEGEWTVLDSREVVSTSNNSFNKAKFANLVLGKINGNVLESVLHIHSNIDSPNWRWTDQYCTRKDIIYSNKYDSSIWSQKCLEVNHLVGYLQTAKGQYGDVRSFLVKNDIKWPTLMLNFSYSQYSERGEAMNFRYSVDPTLYGFKSSNTGWALSEWHKDRIDKDQRRQAFMNKFIHWAEEYGKVLDQTFSRKIIVPSEATGFSMSFKSSIDGSLNPAP